MKNMPMPVFKKQYGSNINCLRALLEWRKSEDGLCFNPTCNAPIDRFYRPLKKKKAFICSRCLKHFFVGSGSILQDSHVEIKDWFEIIYRVLLSRNGISANEIHREFGYSYKTIFRLLHLVRQQMEACLQSTFESTFVEIDESYCLTGKKGLGKHFPFKRGRGSLHTSSLLGIVERGGKVRLLVIPNASADTLLPIIVANVSRDSTIYTDEWSSYEKLSSLGFTHAKVNHSEEFVNTENSASTNNAECLFSTFKRAVRGTWRNVSPQKLQLYLNEQSFRSSHRTYDYGFEVFMRSLGSLSEVYGQNRKAA